MGRKKIEIKKLEPACLRRSTFGKRYKGLSNKAKQLSILCDVPVLLVTTTTSGGYRVTVGENSSFSDVVMRYVNESIENRAKTKVQTFQTLRKSFRDGHVVNVNGMPSINGEEDSERHLEKAKQEIAELEDFLGPLRNLNQLEKVESIEELVAMERSVRYLIARNKKIKACMLELQNANFPHFSTSYLRDPRCSASTAVSTVPMPSNHVGALYGSSNPTGSMQLNGYTVGSGSNPTGSMQLHDLAVGSNSNLTGSVQQHGPTVGSDTAGPHGLQNLSRDPRCSTSTAVPTVPMPSDHIGPLYGSSNLTGSMQLNVSTVGSGSNPIGSMQLHDLAVGSNSNPTGSVQQHGPTFGSDTACCHGPQNLSRNIPAVADVQDSDSLSDRLTRDLSNGVDDNTFFDDLFDLHDSIDENNTTLLDSQQHSPTVGRDAAWSHGPQNLSRDPRCSTSTVVPIVPWPSNHISSLYGSNNLTGEMQQNGSTVDSGSNPTGSMQQHGQTVGSYRDQTGCAQQHGPTVGSDTAWSHGPQNLSRNVPSIADFQDSDSLLDRQICNSSDGFDENTFFDELLDFPDADEEN